MGLPADMGWCAEGLSAYPKRKAMFEERKARMGSEIANVKIGGFLTSPQGCERRVTRAKISDTEARGGRLAGG